MYLPVLLALLLLGTQEAHSQGIPQISTEGRNELISTTTTVGCVASTVAGLVVLTVQQADEHARNNVQSIRLMLARGSGSFASDIAAHVGLTRSDVPRVGALLRGARPELEPLLRGDAPDRGFAFFAAAEKILRRDPELGPRMSLTPRP